MRVTAETRSATRQRILDAAIRLFAAQGFEATTTRDLAREAEIAAGTLFNYFPSKEAIVACLAGAALAESKTDFEYANREGAGFEESLFAFVAAGLRKLKPLRPHLPALTERALSPLTTGLSPEEQELRISQLEVVVRLGHRHGYGEIPPLALQVYWSLYVGLLLFWAKDPSPHQEDTLALLDHSLEMFVAWLERRPSDLAAEPNDKLGE